MKIALFGAHGRVGQAFLRFVKEDDRYMVRSLIRTNREEMLAGMFQVTGNSRNQEDVLETIKGSDIVVSCLSTDGDDTLSVSMEHIVQAMKQTGTSRIITIGTAGILKARRDLSFTALKQMNQGEPLPESLKNMPKHLKFFNQLN